MPRITTFDDEGEPIERYQWLSEYVTPTPEVWEDLKNWRKRAIQDREYFLVLQKQIGREDPDYAKFLKDCAKYYMRLIRAITLHIPWFGVPDLRQQACPPFLWPLDLSYELDEVSRHLYLVYG